MGDDRRPAPTIPVNRPSLSSRIAIGVGTGAMVGLFVGERASALQILADAYVKLLQMTVLPYVTVSIVGGLGALSAAQARTLGARLGLVLALVWALTLTTVFLFPLMFPPHKSASFFSATLIEEREPFDLLNLYIPSNPFHSLANNIVPAVVLFSIMVGVALTAVRDKAHLLEVLRVVGDAVSNATHFVVTLTPYGVFAIAAVVAGTLSFDELKRLEVYIVCYGGMAMLLSLWVLPALVAALTPIPYRTLLSRTSDVMVMAFMTTSLFAVLPLITEKAKALIEEYGGANAAGRTSTDVLVAASFNFPHAGKLLSLSFLLFAGWFSDARVPLSDYPRLAGSGLLVMFGSANAAVPFLLDMLRLPEDTFRLFVTSGVVNARFGTLVAAIHTLTVALLGSCALSGLLTINGRRVARFAIVTVSLAFAVVGGTRVLLAGVLNRPFTKDVILSNMGPLRDRGPARVYESEAEVAPLPPVVTSVLERVRRSGVLRVGYFDDSLPYAFVNARGELVGFDIEMAHQLARDLDVKLELMPASRAVLESGLDTSLCDLVMSGVVVSTDRLGHLRYSSSYLDETVAFVVPDHLASSFSEWSNVRSMTALRLAAPRAPYYQRKIRDELKDAEIVPVDSLRDMFGPRAPRVDAFVVTAERGSAYTLLHPEYSVVVPKPRPFKVPLAYVIAGRDSTMASMVDTWIELKRKDGTIDELFAHWILGQDSAPKQPRWSVARDLLHWIR